MTAYFLSENDVIVLKNLADQVRQGNIGGHKGRTTIYSEEAQSPDVQLIVPTETIPKKEGFNVSMGECQICTIRNDVVEEMAVGILEVYNLTETSLVSGTPYTAIKTKQGKWVVPANEQSSSEFYIVQFQIISKVLVGTGTYETAVPETAQVAYVRNSGFGMTSIPEAVNGNILVYDDVGCFFNELDEDLIDRRGYAVYMKKTGLDLADLMGTGTTPAETGTGTGLGSSEGRWEVISLCCPPA